MNKEKIMKKYKNRYKNKQAKYIGPPHLCLEYGKLYKIHTPVYIRPGLIDLINDDNGNSILDIEQVELVG